MPTVAETKYLRFDEVLLVKDDPASPFHLVPARKTRTFHVVSKRHGFTLGEIRWHGAWRQYVFFPDEDTLFNRVCLDDISSFIKRVMDERKGAA